MRHGGRRRRSEYRVCYFGPFLSCLSKSPAPNIDEKRDWKSATSEERTPHVKVFTGDFIHIFINDANGSPFSSSRSAPAPSLPHSKSFNA